MICIDFALLLNRNKLLGLLDVQSSVVTDGRTGGCVESNAALQMRHKQVICRVRRVMAMLELQFPIAIVCSLLFAHRAFASRLGIDNCCQFVVL